MTAEQRAVYGFGTPRSLGLGIRRNGAPSRKADQVDPDRTRREPDREELWLAADRLANGKRCAVPVGTKPPNTAISSTRNEAYPGDHRYLCRPGDPIR